jgi:hypothetical protein
LNQDKSEVIPQLQNDYQLQEHQSKGGELVLEEQELQGLSKVQKFILGKLVDK